MNKKSHKINVSSNAVYYLDFLADISKRRLVRPLQESKSYSRTAHVQVS